MNYDALVDLIHVAEEACTTCELHSKALALRNLQTVLRRNPIISQHLQHGMATELRKPSEFDYFASAPQA